MQDAGSKQGGACVEVVGASTCLRMFKLVKFVFVQGFDRAVKMFTLKFGGKNKPQ